LIVGAIVVGTYWLVSWLLLSDSSPVRQRLVHEETEDYWMWVYYIPAMISRALFPERWWIARIAGLWVLSSCFWFGIGFGTSLVLKDPYRARTKSDLNKNDAVA
jgi:hypothetical protein